ncbi:MAG: sigma-70 family RNA polymerase sigma factor [Deltaproteobacteria bacterium]|nr:sigma-70 family RNA polymerase sigma factor [Deltaproteobacteria bacterium]
MTRETTDDQLLTEARAGKRAALEELLERHEPQIYRFALRMCGAPQTAKDVLQETLLAAFKGLHDFRGEARLSTWLFQVARSFCSKANRRRAGEPTTHDPLDAPAASHVATDASRAPDAVAHAREVGEVLRAALAALPEQQREVIVLKDVQGLPVDEVAAVLGESVAATKSRLHRARLELRGLLQGVLGDAAPHAPCPELALELAGYAAGEIDRSTCERMEAHLSRCPRCCEACESLKSTVKLCSSVEGDQVPAPIKAAIRAALAAQPMP